ncbi:MAG: NADH-quinone oxidoreductase subunit J, partial [Emcibacteraceae bacterium]|nr:NADH-quinone oxidoreductase subunit J [Emcibacteraceae bacterium]
NEVTNTDAIGRILYTDYMFLFQLAGLILLVAMVGAIVLTHRKRPGVKKQNIGEQVRRRRHEAFEAVDVKPGEGI